MALVARKQFAYCIPYEVVFTTLEKEGMEMAAELPTK